jgi:hypothetical protein
MSEPILSSDPNAVAALSEKLAALCDRQTKMKAVNAAWRKFVKTGDASALRAFGIDENVMKEKIDAAYSWEKQPYVGWQLTNLGAQIRSVKARINAVSQNQAAPPSEIAGKNGIRYEDSPADNRVRLFFPDIPSREIRQSLKSNGFRWTPTLGCWQAYRNYRAEMFARTMLKGDCGCGVAFVDPKCEHHGAHEYHGAPEPKLTADEIQTRIYRGEIEATDADGVVTMGDLA